MARNLDDLPGYGAGLNAGQHSYTLRLYIISVKFLILSFIGLLLIGCSNPDLYELKNNVYLNKLGNGNFELIFDKGKEEWVYSNVDSLSVAKSHYGFLFYGISRKGSETKWFYITGAPPDLKKGFGNWYDGEFRNYRLKELPNGKQLYQNLKSTDQVWNEINGSE